VYRRLRFGCAYRRIELSRGKFAIVDPDDFYWLSRHKWSASGIGHKFYAVRTTRGPHGRKSKTHSMHREIARTPKGLECDHINGDGLDNRKANLRSATRQQNIWNSSKRRTARFSKYKGVSRSSSGRLWRATIIANGKWTHLGSYKDEKEAAKAYDRAAREKFGQYAKLNFPKEAEKPP
jgi:hypothetical protein